ncbi:MAG: RNA ligase RtcB family protein [Pseudomonadota bacterium]
MGNYVQKLSEGVTLIASDDTWIEGEAIQQLHTTSKLPGMRYVAGMPDLHPGRGYPVGAAFFSTGYFYPALIGNDIGCGMSLWKTNIDVNKVGIQKLEKRLGNIDGALDESWRTLISELAPVHTPYHASLGTIGGGNHFAELQRIDEIYDETALQALQLDKKQLLLLVHSGSRGLGQAILRDHVERHQHHGLACGSDDAVSYLTNHAGALHFAEANRELIARRILERLNTTGSKLVDVHHNLLQAATLYGEEGWLHRKGATPSDAGLVIIPGSRGDFSYLVAPVSSEESLFSLAHGAGRKWMRSQCKDRLSKRYTLEQLNRTKLGSYVVCQDRALIYEEAPEAYKPIDNIISTLKHAELIHIIARLKPLLTYKTRGGCCE